MENRNDKKYCVCGICEERIPKYEMVRDAGSETGWICLDCQAFVHPEYDDEF